MCWVVECSINVGNGLAKLAMPRPSPSRGERVEELRRPRYDRARRARISFAQRPAPSTAGGRCAVKGIAPVAALLRAGDSRGPGVHPRAPENRRPRARDHDPTGSSEQIPSCNSSHRDNRQKTQRPARTGAWIKTSAVDFCPFVQAVGGGPGSSPAGATDWLRTAPAATHHMSFPSSEQPGGSGGMRGCRLRRRLRPAAETPWLLSEVVPRVERNRGRPPGGTPRRPVGPCRGRSGSRGQPRSSGRGKSPGTMRSGAGRD